MGCHKQDLTYSLQGAGLEAFHFYLLPGCSLVIPP